MLESKYAKLSNLYLKSSSTSNSYNYGTLRQHNYATSASNQYKQSLLDSNSVDKIMSYNYGMESKDTPSFYGQNTSITSNNHADNIDLNLAAQLNDSTSANSTAVSSLSEMPSYQNSNGSTLDSKSHNNSLKYIDHSKYNSNTVDYSSLDLTALSSPSTPHSLDDSVGLSFKFKDNKSPNLGFLSSEKNVRLIDNINPSNLNPSLSSNSNNLEDVVSNSIGNSIVPNNYNLYSMSKND
jgi:Tfp pilus assembly protein PilV